MGIVSSGLPTSAGKAPKIGMKPTVGPNIHEQDLLWAIWSARAMVWQKARKVDHKGFM